MEKKFTKGEWTIDSRFATSNSCYWQMILSDEGGKIAEVKGIHCNIQNEECDANAKLIAAAPLSFENHVINSGHCDSLIEMIEDGRIDAAKRLINFIKDNCEYSIKKATE